MSKKVLVVITIAVFTFMSGIGLADEYVQRPGVLSPDQVDFGGRTVTFLIGDLGYTGPNGGEPLPERVAEAEELFNVKIQTQSLGTKNVVETIMSRIMSNDSVLDVIRMPHRYGYYTLVSNGMLLPLSDVLPCEYYENLPNADRYCIEKLVYQDKLYGFGITYGLFNATMMFTVYNRDIIEAEGLEDPFDLYLDGEWCYETMTKLAMAATKDKDGDGKPDQFGIEDKSVSHDTRIYRMGGANGAEIAKLDEDGKWVFAYNQPEALDVMTQVAQLRKDLQVTGGKFDNGTALFYTHNHLAGTRNYNVNFGIVPVPSMVPGEYKYPVFDFAMNMLPLNSEYPEGLITLTEFLFREEDGQDFLDYNVNSYMKDREHFTVFQDAVDNWQGEGDPFQELIWSTMQEPVVSVINGEKGAAQAMDEIAPTVQALLDDLFKQ